MIDSGRLRSSCAAAVVAALLLASAAWAQPPVARPQPPPKAPQGSTPATTSGTTSAGSPATRTGTPPATGGTGSTAPAGSGAAAAPTARPVAPGTLPATAKPAATPAVVPTAAASDNAPDPATLGVPVFPNAQYFATYDAGGAGQHFYLYGTSQPYGDVVNYYRTVLKDKGDEVFDAPGTHMFEVGKFRDDQVAFPPGVTVKDYTAGGSAGLTNPRPGGSPQAFRTVIQIVPPATQPVARPR